MKAVLRPAALGATLLASCALGEDVTGCFLHGKTYADAALDTVPNAGYVAEEADCQRNCQANLNCNQWTFKAVGNPLKGILNNGCWALSGNPELKEVNVFDTAGRVVSGPRLCPTQSPNASITAPGTALPGTFTLAPIAVPPTLASVSTTLMVLNDTQKAIGNLTNGTNVTGPVAGATSGKGLPTWTIIFAGACVAVLVGLVLLCVACAMGGEKASKKKKKTKRSAKADLPKGEEPAAATLERMEAPPESAPLMQVAPSEPVNQQAVAPMQMMSTTVAPMAAPVQTMGGYQQVVYQQSAAPVFTYQMAGMPARQPQFTVG